MTTLLVRDAALLVTMDGRRREIAGGALFARDGVIEAVGPSAELPATADEVIDARGQIVIPGLVNTHHHMYQTLTRVVPAAQDHSLFGWLQALYPIWARLTPEMAFVSTQIACAIMCLRSIEKISPVRILPRNVPLHPGQRPCPCARKTHVVGMAVSRRCLWVGSCRVPLLPAGRRGAQRSEIKATPEGWRTFAELSAVPA